MFLTHSLGTFSTNHSFTVSLKPLIRGGLPQPSASPVLLVAAHVTSPLCQCPITEVRKHHALLAHGAAGGSGGTVCSVGCLSEDSQPKIKGRVPSLYWGCCNTALQATCPKITGIHAFTVLGAGSQRSECEQSDGLWGRISPVSSSLRWLCSLRLHVAPLWVCLS